MANELNLFDVSTETPTDAWAHGSAAAKAWLTGSLRTEDGLDFSGEFDAQFSAKFGTDALKGVAHLEGDVTGAAHAGIRLQAGMPLDLFEAAGIIARLRLEASANVRASVTASMSLGEMRSLVTDALPVEARPYVDIVLDEIRIGATVWARASFAAMIISELVAAIELFPRDGSGPGVTAYFHYGFGWGYGAGWGVITNVGFDLKRMLRRISDQAELDLRTALEAYRTEQNLAADDSIALTTELAEVLLPLVLDALVTWCERQLDDDADDTETSLGDSLAEALRTLLVDAILPRILEFAAEKVIEQFAHVPPDAAREIWGELAAAVVELRVTSDDPAAAVGTVALLLVRIATYLPANVGGPLASAARCAAAIVALATDTNSPSLRAVLTTDATPGTGRLQVMAGGVLGDELATLLVDQGLVPGWVEPLFASAAAITSTLTSDGTAGALTTDQAVALLHNLLTGLDTMMTQEHLWDRLATDTGFPELIQAMKAQTSVVIELCASLQQGNAVDAHSTREAISVAILMLIGQPIAQVITTVAERGLAQVPPALRALADVVDQSSSPTSIDAGWDTLALQVVGSSVGFPVAQLLRHAAGTAGQWRDTRLPAELAMLRRMLEIDLADDFATMGPTAAVSHFKQQFLPILGQHVIDVVLTSHEMILRDSVNLFADMVVGTVNEIVRTLELSAIISFRLVEEAIDLAERGVTALQQEEAKLEADATRYSAEFMTALAGVTHHIRGLDSYVGAELTDWMVGQCMGPAAAAQMPDWIRSGLRAIVTAAVNISSGGVLNMLSTALGSIADLIDASAEALRLTAASPEGSLVGVQPLLEALVASDRLPSVVIPIAIDIPNPFMPFVLPSIHIEFARVPIPARALSSMLLTIVFGSTGLAPLIDTLNTTGASLRVTKGALATVHDAIAGSSAAEMRQSLDAARPRVPLGIDVLAPLPASVAPASGVIEFRVRGANLSFVDPASAGLPAQAISRVQVMVAGQVVSVGDIDWQEVASGLVGRLHYGDTAAGDTLWLREGPVAVVVAVVDGDGVRSAQAAWHFVVERPPLIELVVVPVWFPIAAGLLAPVPQLEEHTPVLTEGHIRLDVTDLPVPAMAVALPPRTFDRLARTGARANGGVAAPARTAGRATGGAREDGRGRAAGGDTEARWARVRPGVRVTEHREPDFPVGFLHLERLGAEAAAWCSIDGRFGTVEWESRRLRVHATELDGPAQTLRAHDDAIAIATATDVRCFDAGSGEPRWRFELAEGSRLLDATRDVLIVAEAKRVVAIVPERGELWSTRTSGVVDVRVSGERLVLAATRGVSVLALASGEEEWRGRPPGEVVLADDRLLVPGRADTAVVYSLSDGVSAKLKTSEPVARLAPHGIRIAGGPVVPVVTMAGAVVLLDFLQAVEADRARSTPMGETDAAWLSGPFLLTNPPFAVAPLWGGVATSIPLPFDAPTATLVAGPAQALVRSAERTLWLELS